MNKIYISIYIYILREYGNTIILRTTTNNLRSHLKNEEYKIDTIRGNTNTLHSVFVFFLRQDDIQEHKLRHRLKLHHLRIGSESIDGSSKWPPFLSFCLILLAFECI